MSADRFFSLVCVVLIVISVLGLCSQAAGAVPGPIKATVERVIDGDTIEVTTDELWPGGLRVVKAGVRINGIDTPELRGKCPAEREKALAAKVLVETLLLDKRVMLYDVETDKYGGRVRAAVYAGERSVATELLAAGLARPNAGEARGSWCGT